MVKQYVNYYWRIFRRDILKNRLLNEHKRFLDENGEEKKYCFQLNEKSIVFDVGGYLGDYSDKVFNLYKCNIFIFEIIPEYCELIKVKFQKNSKVRIFNFGFSNEDCFKNIATSGDSSNTFSKGLVKIELKLFSSFFNQHKIKKIDLIKINIEGGEYELLEDIFKNNLQTKIIRFLIQFHDFIPGHRHKVKSLREKLKESHLLNFKYEYVWELWEIKNPH